MKKANITFRLLLKAFFGLILMTIGLIMMMIALPSAHQNWIAEGYAAQISLPEPTGYVVDTVHLLSNEIKSEIETICTRLDSIAQVAVCIVKTTYPYSLEEYSIKLAEKWKVGYKDEDNGVILLVVSGDRRVRIEVGRGIEYKITDAEAGRILDNDVVPYLRENKWAQGVLSGIKAIEKRLR